MSALLVDATVQNGKIRIVDEPLFVTRSQKLAKQWGDGCCLKVRIEPEDEAAVHGDFKYLFGYVLGPVAEETGHTQQELLLMAKLQFLPDDGRTSLTQLNREELRAFTESTEQWLREECPDAFLLYDHAPLYVPVTKNARHAVTA